MIVISVGLTIESTFPHDSTGLCLCGNSRVVGNEQDRNTLPVEVLQDPHDIGGCLRIEISCGFIGQYDGRLAGNDPGNGHSLLLSARKLTRPVIQSITQAHLFQRFDRHLLPHFTFDPTVGQREHDILQGRPSAEQIKALKHKSDLLIAQSAEPMVIELQRIFAIDADCTRCGPVQTTNNVHQGGLSRAGTTGNGQELSRRHAKSDIPEGFHR